MQSLRVVFSVCLLLAVSAPICRAQNLRESGKTAGLKNSSRVLRNKGLRVDEETAKTSKKTVARDIVGFKGPNGKRVLVPFNATDVVEFLKWRATHKGRDSHVSEVDLEGNVEDGRVLLTATIHVIINRDHEWVPVLLGLNQAVLRNRPDYRGVGEAMPVNPFQPEAGYRWLFKGKGQHELTLSMFVPTQKNQTPERRLLLAVPATAVSHLKLRVAVPHQRLKLERSEKLQAKTKPLTNADSEIEVYGFGLEKLLDLKWQQLPNPKSVPTALRATTSITVGLTGETVLLEAKQQITAIQGNFIKLGVRLPTGFQLQLVETKLYSDHKVDSTDNYATITLTERTTGPVELIWTLKSKFPDVGRELTIAGFDVDHAVQQTGKIAIGKAEGYRIKKRDSKNRLVYRINGNEVSSAYRFHGQPFRLGLDLHKIEPYFTASPHYSMLLSAKRADLEAVVRYQVHRGVVQEVELKWPHWNLEGWEIAGLTSPDLIEQVDFDAENESIRIRLVQPQTGEFELPPLKAHRAVTADETPFDVSLPNPIASSRSPTTLVVDDALNVESELTPSGEPSAELTQSKKSRSRRRSEFRIASQAHVFSVKMSEHDQDIRAETTATLVEVRKNQLLVIQRISYDVAYKPLSEVRLLVPQSLVNRVRFYINDNVASDEDWSQNVGTPFTPEWVENEDQILRGVNVPLLGSQIGKINVVARYSVDLSQKLASGRELPVTLPLIQSSDVDNYSSIRFRYKVRDQIEVGVVGELWQQQPSLVDTTIWTTTEPNAEIPLTLNRSTSHSVQEYSVSKVLIQTVFKQDGIAVSQARYRLDGQVSTVVIGFPPDIAWTNIRWDQEILSRDKILETAPGSHKYRLTVSDSPQPGEHLLTINFRSESAVPADWSRLHRFSAPSFSSGVWVAQTVWEVVLDEGQHLFTNPHSFTPQFRWKRNAIFWWRSPTEQYANLNDWIGDVEEPDEHGEFSQDHSNSYQFSRFGPTHSIEFRSMSRGYVVLLGAGLAWLAGIVLLKIPATRSVITLLTAVFAVALLGLWHSAPIQLLLQPAILGLLLAIAMVLIESSLKRTGDSTILTLSSPSEFMPPSTSMEPSFLVNAGSAVPNAVRSSSIAEPESISTSEPGSNP